MRASRVGRRRGMRPAGELAAAETNDLASRDSRALANENLVEVKQRLDLNSRITGHRGRDVELAAIRSVTGADDSAPEGRWEWGVKRSAVIGASLAAAAERLRDRILPRRTSQPATPASPRATC